MTLQTFYAVTGAYLTVSYAFGIRRFWKTYRRGGSKTPIPRLIIAPFAFVIDAANWLVDLVHMKPVVRDGTQLVEDATALPRDAKGTGSSWEQ